MAGLSKKGQLAMLQFYKLIIAKVEAERVAHADRISNLSKAGKKKMNEKRARKFPKLAKDAKDAVDAVNAVSDEIAFAISDRMKGFRINFESQLLLMYFTKLIFVLGLGDGFGASLLAATKVLADLMWQLDTVISQQTGGVGWKDLPIGQLGFLRSKHQRYKSAVNALVLALDLRLQKAMTKVDPEIRAKDRAKLPLGALKIIQEYAKNDAKAILETLGKKKNRTSKVEAILKRIIHPLAKNIFIPSESVPQYRGVPKMSLAQLVILRTHLAKVISDLDNLGQAIHSSKKPKPNSRTTRMEFSDPHKMTPATMTTLHLSYDPKTQLGMVLCLRARLGQHFELRFHPIGANGKKRKRGGGGDKQRDLNPRDPKKQKEEEEEEPFTILSFPVELIYYITGFMVKSHPTPEETKGLFAFARSTHDLRFYIEDPGLENVISQKFLGTQHTRTREERRLGLEPNVAKRYKAVFNLLGLKKENIKALQAKANRNIQTYKIEVEKRKKAAAAKKPREKEWTIRSWPWWYFRALANHRSFQSIINPFVDDESDVFSMALISVVALQPDPSSTSMPPKIHRLRRFREGTSVHSPKHLLDIGRDNMYPVRMYKLQKWTSGADLMVIPIDKLVQRALTYSYNIGRKMELKSPTRLTISVSESMLVFEAREGPASFRKEVKMTGLDKLPDTMVRHGPPVGGKVTIHDFDLKIILQIQQAYLGKDWSQFLGPQRKPLPYLHLESLSLEHVYFENVPKEVPLEHVYFENVPKEVPLDLSALTGPFLSKLRFGPSNLSHVPKLFCPSPHLTELRLVTPNTRNSILLWDLPEDPTPCFPNLNYLEIKGNVKIWKSPLVEKIGKFPMLNEIILESFPGHDPDLLRLVANLQNVKRIDIVVDLEYFSAVVESEVFGNVHFQHFYWPPEM